ncbi:MAG: DUF3048 domain-containing protein [Defluviitaleaceae bacterium]|nr:DUF3048 domain-containing protein [Defluviitaleaceae bacterium]
MSEIVKIIKSKKFLVSFSLSLGITLSICVIIFMVIFFAAREEEPEPQAEAPESELFFGIRIPMPDGWVYVEPDEFPYPTQYSMLTGQRIFDEYAARRPLAVVVNNIRRALPQSGIASADIIYEMLAEGDITRLIAIFQSHFPDKIGSVRSARDYFIDFAYNHDALFIHHGSSPAGYDKIRTTRITNLDGGRLEGRVFWRDTSYPEWSFNTGTRPREHSSYTGREQLEAYLEAEEIRSNITEGAQYGFSFGEIPTESAGKAEHIIVPFSPNYTRTFVLDDGVYLAYNRDGEHLDADTQEQVSVSNVLIQLASMHVIAGDEAGRRSIRTVGSGNGFLATQGEYYDVTWEKSSIESPTRWYFADGTPLVLSAGKTWVCVFQTTGKVTLEELAPTEI